MNNFTTKLLFFFALLVSIHALAQPTVTSPTVAAISDVGATLGGTATGGTITARGTAWKTSSPVAVTDNPQVQGSGSGTFTDPRTGMPAATQIFYIAYATNGGGTGKSSEASFYTLATPPAGQPASFIASANNSTQIGLAFTAANDAAVVADGYVIYRHNNTTAPDLSDLLNGAAPPGTLADGSTLIVTTTNTATTQNDAVTAGNIYTYTIVPFTKGSNNATYNYLKAGALTDIASTNNPAISSPTHTNITHQSADLGGTIATEYNTIQERGTVFKTSAGVTITDSKQVEGGTADGVFSDTRTGLTAATQYFYKAYVKTALNTTLTTESSFYTLKAPPTGQPAVFTAVATTNSKIVLTYSSPASVGADGYLILRGDNSMPSTSGVTNGVIPATSGGAAYFTDVSSGTTIDDNTVVANHTYYYVIIPFTFSAVSTQTYNYLKAGALSDSDTPSNGITVTTPLSGFVCTGSFGPMGDLVISESSKADFSNSGTLILDFAGSGYIFKPGSLPTPTYTGSANITSASAVADYTTITITYSIAATNKFDAITIKGIQAQTSASGNGPVNIKRNGGTAVINGAPDGTVFGTINSTSANTQTFPFCKGDAITGSVTSVPGGSTIDWYSDASLSTVIPSLHGLTSPALSAFSSSGLSTASPTNGIPIQFYAKDANTCISVISIIVNDSPGVDANSFAGNLTGGNAICSGAVVTLGGAPTLSIPTVAGTYGYQWNGTGPEAFTISDATKANPTVTLTNVSSSTVSYSFNIQVTDPNNCKATATKNIEVKPKIIPVLTQPTSTTFSTNTPPVDLIANPAGGTFSGVGVVNTSSGYKFSAVLANDPNSPPGTPQSYPLFYTVTSGGCTTPVEQIATMTLSNQLFAIASEYCSSEHPNANNTSVTPLAKLGADAAAETRILSSVDSWNTISRFYYGPLTAYAAWISTTSYGTSAKVKYNGKAYSALLPSTGVVPPNATYWIEEEINTLKVSFNGTIRNYYEGYYGGNIGGSTLSMISDTYTVGGNTFNKYEMLTNTNYPECPTCDYNYPAFYLDFINASDIDYLMGDWSPTSYYYPGSVVKYSGTYYRLLLTYNDSPYYSIGQDPPSFSGIWNPIGSTFDTGSRYRTATASGFYILGQYVAIHKNPLVSFTGLTSGLNFPSEFCNANTDYVLIGNANGTFGLGSFDMSYDGSNGSFQNRPGLIDGNPQTGQATFNGSAAYAANSNSSKQFYVRYLVDPGTKGSDAKACIGSTVQIVHVNNNPSVLFTTPSTSPSLCFDNPTIDLLATSSSPVVLSGFGVVDKGDGSGNGKFTASTGITDLSAATGINYTYVTRPTISVLAQTTDVNGCVGQATKNIEVHPLPPIGVTPFPTSLCFTSTPFTIQGQQAQSFWKIDYKDVVNTDVLGSTSSPQKDITNFSPANLFNNAVNSFGANPLATLSFDFIYTSYDPDLCLNTLPPINVKIAPKIPVTIAGINDNEEFCSNLTPARQVTLTPTGGNLTVTRNGVPVSPPTVIAGQFFFSPIPLDGGDYVFDYDVITGNNCSNPVTAHVKVLPSPVADFLAPPKCEGDVISFNANGTQNINGTPTYTWTLEGQPVNGQNTTYKFSGVGTYTVGLNVSYPAAGTTNTVCSSFLSLDQYVGLIPQVDFDIADVCENDATKFTSTSNVTPISQAEWDFGDGNTLSFGGVNQAVPASASTSGTFGNPVHSFSGANTYTVTLTGRTSALTGNCSNTKTRSISILKYLHGYNAINPYVMKALNGEDGFWVAEDKKTNSTWEFGAPDKVNIKSPDKSWVTSISGVYKSGDVSYMNSPCLDLSAFSRPSISVNMRYVTDPGKDGAVMQYSIDGGATWVRLGSMGSGLNWYNEQGISSSPGGQNAFGWSGKDQLDWEVGKHSLSDVAGNNKVRFRIAFASDEKDTLDGFAFNDVKIEERNRITLIESFTNVNAPDADANRTAFQNIPDGETVKIEYHTPSPGSDPIYLQNPNDFNSRAAYYGLTNTNVSIPRGYIDGSSQGTFNSPWATNYQPLRSLVSAPFDILLENPASVNPDEISVKVTLTALENVVADKLDLQIAVIEKQVGTDKFVLRKLLPFASGTRLATPMAKNATASFTQTWAANNITSISELAIVAFVQDQATTNVLQSARLLSLPNPPTVVTGIGESSDFDAVKVYPNPADRDFTIQIPSSLRQGGSITLADQLGKVVHTSAFTAGSKSKAINTRDLTAGLYILKLESGKETIHQKVVIVHQE